MEEGGTLSGFETRLRRRLTHDRPPRGVPALSRGIGILTLLILQVVVLRTWRILENKEWDSKPPTNETRAVEGDTGS